MDRFFQNNPAGAYRLWVVGLIIMVAVYQRTVVVGGEEQAIVAAATQRAVTLKKEPFGWKHAARPAAEVRQDLAKKTDFLMRSPSQANKFAEQKRRIRLRDAAVKAGGGFDSTLYVADAAFGELYRRHRKRVPRHVSSRNYSGGYSTGGYSHK